MPQPMVSPALQQDVSPPLSSITPEPQSPPAWLYEVPTPSSSPCSASSVGSLPTITALAPTTGPVGTEVTISGGGFTSQGNAVYFGAGYIPNLASTDGTTLVFTVPGSLDPACLFAQPRCLLPSYATQPGTYHLAVASPNGMSNRVIFTVVASSIP